MDLNRHSERCFALSAASFVLLSTVVLTTAGCFGPKFGKEGDGTGEPGPNEPIGPGGFALPDGGAQPAAPVDRQCAGEAYKAEIVPLDLMLLVDSSFSMLDPAGNGSKWMAAQYALDAFIRDPRSTGLGVCRA